MHRLWLDWHETLVKLHSWPNVNELRFSSFDSTVYRSLRSAYAIGFYKYTTQVKVSTSNFPTMETMTVCLRVYTMGRRKNMYLMSYASGDSERFVFFKNGDRLGVRVNGGNAW